MNTSVFSGKDIRRHRDRSVGDHAVFAERRVILVENSGFFQKSPEDLAAYLENCRKPRILFLWKKKWISAAKCISRSKVWQRGRI